MCFSITKSKIISATTSTMALPYSVILMKLFLVFMSSIFLVDAAGKSYVIGSHEPVKAVVGDDVILPCHLEPPFDVKNLTVEWKCNDSTVHLYRSRNDHLVIQHERFKDRTSLFPDEMSRGNISLKLTNVTEQDAGNYSCYVPKLNSQVKEGYVTLIVETQTEHDEKRQTGDRSIGTGGIIGIVVAVVAVAVAAVAVHFFLKNKKCFTTTIETVVGHDIILTCDLNTRFDKSTSKVTWKRNRKTVHAYRKGNDHLVDQDEKFRGRTSLFPDEMSRGNISLKLTNVTEQDAGNYTCYVSKLLCQVRKGYVTLVVATDNPVSGAVASPSSPAVPEIVKEGSGIPLLHNTEGNVANRGRRGKHRGQRGKHRQKLRKKS